MDFLTSSVILASIAWICVLISRAQKVSKLPPGPYGLPIIGNILQLGPKPHHSLAKLSQKYGPVMSLKLGSITTVVFSSAETAKLVLQTHDSSFSSRSAPVASKALRHDEFSVGWLPAGSQWRKLRKICKEQMFSAPRLDASEDLRREKLQKLRDYLAERCERGIAVDLGEAAFTTTLNLMSASLFSAEFARFDSELSQEMKEVISRVVKSVSTPNLADYFPVLKAVDPQGIFKETELNVGKLFAKLDEIIDEKLRSGGDKRDLVEALLEINRTDEALLSRDDIRHLLLDLLVAGTDTTSGTVEWTMTELIRNPQKMAKLRNEIRSFMSENGKQQVQESDIPLLPYLQAVVKENFRLHPANPFLVPHKANCDVEISGYIVPKNAQIFVNLWASGRDSKIWRNPNEFLPERFLNENNNVDFKGRDFELIPFGSGRRMCPGLPLADRMVHQMLVTFVGNYDWKLENMKPEEMDMNENFGVTLEKAIPLKAIPIKV
ncbi:cytochrome P450 76T24-like [Salvia hispanica]|uniref:cytochrome P450 76T24-like n=1 Tax=Salvia hispanica TaxID=49212 RepID=UPI00200980CB|nr:cytochrome P450 76T24-like [Salvia hispanica]